MWHLKSLAVAAPALPTEQEDKSVSFHDKVVMVGGRGITFFQANFSGDVTSEVAFSTSMVYIIAHMERPSILCMAGSSRNIDICAPSYNYRFLVWSKSI